MLSDEIWEYISTPKTTENTFWTASKGTLNSFLSQLPWYALDQPLQQDCLLYNIDSKGALHLLLLGYIVQIRTTAKARTIIYKHDKRHAALHMYRVMKERWSMVGIQTITINS